MKYISNNQSKKAEEGLTKMNEIEKHKKRPLDGLGIVATVLAIPGYCFAAVVFVIFMVKLNLFKNVTSVQFVLFFVAMDAIPIIQVILGITSLKKNPNAPKWPAIVGIVLGSIGIVLFSLILIGAY